MNNNIYKYISSFLLIINLLCGTRAISNINDKQFANYHLATCPPLDNAPEKILLKEDSDTSDYVDNNREIKDFSTKFIVNEFFTSEKVLFNFLQLVYQTMESKLDAFKEEHNLDDAAVLLMFKGGNVLRMVARQFIAMLPKEAQSILEQAYDGIYSRSDADFSVLIDPDRINNLNYEDTRDKLIKITYEALNEIREDFSEHPQRYFSFLGFMPQAKKVATLNNYFAKLGDDKALLADPNNSNWYQAQIEKMQLLGYSVNRKLKCRYQGHYDYLYENDPLNKSNIIGTPLSKKPHFIANSINKTLKWAVVGQPEKIVRFDLLRSKVYFEYSYIKDNYPYRKPIGGELIDVSFPHQDDFRLKHFLANIDKWVTTYQLRYDKTGRSFKLKAESIDGIAQDLYEVVFAQFDRPWHDPKFEKRINRLFLLAVVNMLSSDLKNNDIANYISLLNKDIVIPLSKIYELNNKEEANDLLTQSEHALNNMIKQYAQMHIVNNIGQGLIKLIKHELLSRPQEDDKDKFIELMKVINKNINTMTEINKLNLPQIDKNNIYDVDISKLL